MSEPFERTTRYLAADGGKLAISGAILGLVMAVLWLAWLFLAQVPIAVQAQDTQPEADGVYSVTVDQAVAARLKPGQHASIQPIADASGSAVASPLAATVAEVDQANGRVRIELNDHEESKVEGTAWIEIEHVSPATLIARAVEQAFATP